MTTAEQNFQLLQDIEANRDFLLSVYEQNPELLKRAEPRIKQLLDPSWTQKESLSARLPFGMERGASLIELIMFIVIVSVAMAGILLVMNQTTRGSADPLVRKQALAAAYSLLEEVQLQDYLPASGVVGMTQANRATVYHRVRDYDGFNQNAGIYSLTGVAPITGLENYTAGVTVIAAALGDIPAASAVQIDVTVTAPNGEVITATGYRAAY
jgi:MSHA pilin protein MshD